MGCEHSKHSFGAWVALVVWVALVGAGCGAYAAEPGALDAAPATDAQGDAAPSADAAPAPVAWCLGNVAEPAPGALNAAGCLHRDIPCAYGGHASTCIDPAWNDYNCGCCGHACGLLAMCDGHGQCVPRPGTAPSPRP